LRTAGRDTTKRGVQDLLAARLQMAVSLGFHIVFAVIGMAMPVMMVIAEYRYAKSGEAVYLDLAHRWAKGTAILFAVGAVSGTVLSFELGLLWPRFMERAGPLIGIPFSLEGFAFFLEAIFLGVYLYGWDRVSRAAHLAAGVVVAVSGLASGIFVVAVNAWMNTPVGFVVRDGEFADLDLLRAFFSPSFIPEATHMVLAAYASVAFAVLGVHAAALLRTPSSVFHRKAAKIALGLAAVAIPLQLVSGDFAAKNIAEYQPVKLAAAEAHFETGPGAAIVLGGIADTERREVHGAIRIPYLLSVLAKNDPHATVVGLDSVAPSDWPPVAVTHLAFDVMVGSGMCLLGLVAFAASFWVRKRDALASRVFLRAALAASPLGLVAIESGWTVTEVGRQPWIIGGVLRTANAVTPVPHLLVPFATFSLLYVMLGVVVIVLLRRHVGSVPDAAGDAA
jgi:cytochrome d ubiquinol oxidase subunit I